MITPAFSVLKPWQAFLYVDDLVVIDCSEQRMLERLRSICLDQCSFFMHEETFPNHKCTDKVILTGNNKYDVTRKYPILADAEKVRWFVSCLTEWDKIYFPPFHWKISTLINVEWTYLPCCVLLSMSPITLCGLFCSFFNINSRFFRKVNIENFSLSKNALSLLTETKFGSIYTPARAFALTNFANFQYKAA